MDKESYDDLADLYGPKGFYDIDGDGDVDCFEASFMLSDIEEEENPYTPPPPDSSSTNKQRGGCLTVLLVSVALAALLTLIDFLTH